MERDKRELKTNHDLDKLREQLAELKAVRQSMTEKADSGLLPKEDTAGAIRSLVARERLKEKLVDRPVVAAVRYRLVARHHGRDLGVGRVANRCLECQLDNARLYLANSKGVVPGRHKLAPVLNENGDEFAIIKDLFRHVPRPQGEEQAKLFLKLFVDGTVTDLAFELRDQILRYHEKHPHHFTEDVYPPKRSDFEWSLLDSLQLKIKALRKRARV